MVSNVFTCLLLSAAALTLLLFALAEAYAAHRNKIAAVAAIAEAVVFALLTWLFYQITWGTFTPSWLMAALPAGGVVFAINMAHKRLTGRIL